MIDWNGYRALLAVVEHGSFSAAARALGISQPTVGRHVAELESALGARLLVRRGKGVAPSPAGERVLEHVRTMGASAREAARSGADDLVQVEGVVRISSSETLGTLWLTHRLRTLCARHPGLRVELVIDNAVVNLATREADVALRLTRPREAGLVAKRFGTLGLGMFASQAYLDARGAPRKRADLMRHDLIGLSAAGARPPFLRWWHAQAPTERFVLRTNSLLAQQEAARAGWGIALAPCHLLAGDTRLVRVLPRVQVPSLDLWLVCHEDVRQSGRVKATYEALAELLAAERAALGGTP